MGHAIASTSMRNIMWSWMLPHATGPRYWPVMGGGLQRLWCKDRAMMGRAIVFSLLISLAGVALWSLSHLHTAPADVIAQALEKDLEADIAEAVGAKTPSDRAADISGAADLSVSARVSSAAPDPSTAPAHGGVPVEPEGYRTNDYRSPVPATLKGADVIDAEMAWQAWQAKSAVFIDVYPRAPKPPNLPEKTVWREPAHMSIEGAEWLANVGYGVLAPHVESYFRTHLERLSGGDKNKPLIFFCLRDCWMSWNAAKRAVAWGYSNVKWFSEGTDAWQEAGHDLTRINIVK